MNLQTIPCLDPLRVLIVNPLTPAAQLLAIKILSGMVFGTNQFIDLILLVYSNEQPSAEGLKLELSKCAFICTNCIKVSSDLPSITDADIFCFITNFSNPNIFDLEKVDVDEHFDTLYLIIKIANNFSGPTLVTKEEDKDEKFLVKRKKLKPNKKPIKPILIADGLVAIDILKSFSKNMPSDVFFCSTPLPAIAKSVLGEYIKVRCDLINDVFVWAANDEVFHIEVEKPTIINDNVNGPPHCDKELVSKDVIESLNFDHTQYSASWMKKEFIKKVVLNSKKNPYGCIYKASNLAETLKVIWRARSSDNDTKVCFNMGVISDGSLHTVKGCPYVLPLIFCGESWSVNNCFAEENHLKLEIKRLNTTTKKHHEKLICYCKKFLMENVINRAFIPAEEESFSVKSSIYTSSRINN